MTADEILIKNQTLSHEFSLYLFEHPEVAEQIPKGAQIALLPKSDPELCHENLRLAKVQQESNQQIVYVHIEKLKPARSRLVHPKLEILSE